MPTVSIVIPAFDEEPRLGRTLQSIKDAVRGGRLGDITIDRIIVADDGSADRTSDIARSWSDRLPMDIVRLPKNRGKGAATRAGIECATGDYALIYDADGATPIEELPRFLDALRAENASIAIGSRVHGRSDMPVEMSAHRRIIGRLYHALCAGLHPGIADAACGCKLFTLPVAKDIFTRQHIDRFAYDIEILTIAIARGYRIAQVPVRWRAIPKSKVRLIRDGLQMFGSVFSLYIRKMLHRL